MITLFDSNGDALDTMLTESDLRHFLDQFPESTRIRMHREYWYPVFTANMILARLSEVDSRSMLRFAHEVIAEHRYLGHQEVFVDGVETHFAYISVSGIFRYRSI